MSIEKNNIIKDINSNENEADETIRTDEFYDSVDEIYSYSNKQAKDKSMYDSGFTKMRMEGMWGIVRELGDKKTQLLFWLLQNMDLENKVVMTYRDIAKQFVAEPLSAWRLESNMESNTISYKTVAETMDDLQKQYMLVQISQGAYQFNPNVVFRGKYGSRLFQWNRFCHRRRMAKERQQGKK